MLARRCRQRSVLLGKRGGWEEEEEEEEVAA